MQTRIDSWKKNKWGSKEPRLKPPQKLPANKVKLYPPAAATLQVNNDKV